MPPSFDLVVLGSGGGPCETDLSACVSSVVHVCQPDDLRVSYLLKPHGSAWTDGIVALEAGSGMGTLKELLKRDPHLFDDDADMCDGQPVTNGSGAPPSYRHIYDSVRCFLISHAHMDHVASLVLSAGSLARTDERRRVFGTRAVLNDLFSGVFSGRVWPALASFKESDEPHKLLLSPLSTADAAYHDVFPDIAVRAMPISHGLTSDREAVYGSTAFFVRRLSSGAEFLFFGDVEPDSVSKTPRNRDVWRAAAARRIPDVLSALFIECSWPAGRADADLYGHLTPAHLHAELCALAHEVALARRGAAAPVRKKRRQNPAAQRALPADVDVRGVLRGLRVFIIHCKDGAEDDAGRPLSEVITEQVRELVEDDALGTEVLHAHQGMRIFI